MFKTNLILTVELVAQDDEYTAGKTVVLPFAPTDGISLELGLIPDPVEQLVVYDLEQSVFRVHMTIQVETFKRFDELIPLLRERGWEVDKKASEWVMPTSMGHG